MAFELRFSGSLAPAEDSMACDQSVQKVPEALIAELGLSHAEVSNMDSDGRYAYPQNMARCAILDIPHITWPGLP
jgi:hypothetical protein